VLNNGHFVKFKTNSLIFKRIRERRGRGGREGRKEGMPSPCLGVMEGLCDNFTILPFFSLKIIHCAILCNLSCKL